MSADTKSKTKRTPPSPIPPSPKGSSGLTRAASSSSAGSFGFLASSPKFAPAQGPNNSPYSGFEGGGAKQQTPPLPAKLMQMKHDPSTSRNGSSVSLDKGHRGRGGGNTSDASSVDGGRQGSFTSKSKFRKTSGSFSLTTTSTVLPHRPSLDSFESIQLPPSPGGANSSHQRLTSSTSAVDANDSPPPNPLGPLPVPVRKASKQAQLLGMGGDFDGDFEGMENDWPGWGGMAPVPADEGQLLSPNSRVGVKDIAPWDFTEERQNKSFDNLSLRKPSKVAREKRSDADLPKEKKKTGGGLFGLLRRSPSRGDIPVQVVQPKALTSLEEFDRSSMPVFAGALPAKLQARGDAIDVPNSNNTSPIKNGKPVKKQKKPSRTSLRENHSTNDPIPPRSGSIFTIDPSITLDTNLDSMEGIVNLSLANNGSRSPSFSGNSAKEYEGPHSPKSTRSGTANSSPRVDPINLPYRQPPNGRRNSSLGLDPTGQLPFPTASTSGFASSSPRLAASSVVNVLGAGAKVLGRSLTMEHLISPIAGTPPTPEKRIFGANVLESGLFDRRPSFVSAGASPRVRDGTAWIAPDSWAVGPVDGLFAAPDSSDDDEGAEEGEEKELVESDNDEVGTTLGDNASLGEQQDVGSTRVGSLPTTRPGTKSGRPYAADLRSQQKSFMIRIFRPDSSFSTLPVPLTVTAGELLLTLARKFHVNGKPNYALFLREKGIERRMGPNEKPVLLQKRRFEQAGYTDADKIEDLGREDNSYLCKLMYRPTHGAISATEEDPGSSHEIVSLDGKNIETIPIYLYRYAHEIVSLSVARNRPFDLPTDFVQLCTSLRELTLSHMGIKRIPQAVRECFSLSRLDISNNHIVELDHIVLDDLLELTSLKCHNNRLWNLPDYFAQFKSLKYLNLSNNRFDSFPAIICDVTSLVDLDISFNTITTIPSEIGQLVHLDRLILLANTITTIPSTLGSLVKLRDIDVRRNMIADLSSIIGVARLEVLRCDHNQASALDGAWSHMRVLDASSNSFTRFSLLGTGSSLTSLNLSFAKLSSLAADMFDHLGSVETLILDSNQIRVLPEGIGSLSKLVTLSIKNNILDELPSSIGKLQSLQTLQLSGNNLARLPAEIWLCSQLVSLCASSNLLKDFPDVPLAGTAQPDTLDEIDRKASIASSKPPGTATGRVVPPLSLSLRQLYLGDNMLGEDVFGPLSLMTELRHLNLSFNEIYEIPPSSLFQSQQLEELYLSGNKLSSLPPDDLDRLVNLRVMYLNGNKLQTLPAELANVKKLHALDVGSNVLKYNIANWPYDWNWNFNPELRYLNLSGNKRLEIKPGHQNDPSGRGSKQDKMADFTALNQIRTLGLMDVTLMIPSTPDESEDRRVRTSPSEINLMGYGIADTLGDRDDTLSLVDIVIPSFRSRDDEAIFGLFDGVSRASSSSGRLVKYLQMNFAAVFTLELSRLKGDELTGDALRRTFLAINRDYGNSLLPSPKTGRKDSETSLGPRPSANVRTGAAGIVVYIRKKRMYVANAGNALAVIAGRGGSARLVAKKHEPFDAAEIQRIRTAEGWISPRGYVNDEVDVSRAFGFYNVFPAINVSPNIDEIDLVDTDEFVIIANRGLWEYMSYQAAVDIARTERADPMVAAGKLRDLAISYGSSQNLMVMVLGVGDLFKAKQDYRRRGGNAPGNDDEGFYGAQRAGVARRGKEEGAGERYLNLLDREVPPPVGQVALVFTDIRNSTALWETNPGMQTAIRMHNQLLRRQLRAIGGYEVKTEGDAFMVSFPTVTSALLWCLTVQLELLREDWPQEILDSEECKEIVNEFGEVIYRGLSVRMGIHWGAPLCEADPITRRMDYYGTVVNRAARISAVADGGQISASQTVIDIIKEVVVEQKPDRNSFEGDSDAEEEEWLDPNEKRDVLALRRLGFGISELGERKLKGLENVEVLSLLWPKSLKHRIKTAGDDKSKAQVAEVYDPTAAIVDVALLQNLGRLCHRLETVSSAITHPDRPTSTSTALPVSDKRKTASNTAVASILTQTIRPDATDVELTALFESYTIRIENCLASLVLHQLGPINEVLAALASAIKTDQRSLLVGLARYRAAMAEELAN